MKKNWRKQKSYRMARGQEIGTLRTRWLADIDRDKNRPFNPTYPLIIWSLPRVESNQCQ